MRKLSSTQKINRCKRYFLAIFYLITPRKIRHYVFFNKTPTESLATGVIMIKIKYFRSFIGNNKMKKELYFPKYYTHNLNNQS